MEIFKLSKVPKPEDVFVDVQFNFIYYEFTAFKNNVLIASASSSDTKFEEFLSRVKEKVGTDGRIVVNDLEFDFNELIFRDKNGQEEH